MENVIEMDDNSDVIEECEYVLLDFPELSSSEILSNFNKVAIMDPYGSTPLLLLGDEYGFVGKWDESIGTNIYFSITQNDKNQENNTSINGNNSSTTDNIISTIPSGPLHSGSVVVMGHGTRVLSLETDSAGQQQ
eukprot:GHVR01132748.1.p1 GENE.GHVR01132748.1~~GHVR01132748.1.p1  ORF type:complete len:135 (-),score=32.40 GHVR01132748.1:715-1119(-)